MKKKYSWHKRPHTPDKSWNIFLIQKLDYSHGSRKYENDVYSRNDLKIHTETFKQKLWLF